MATGKFIKATVVILLFVLVVGAPTAAGGQIFYVDDDADGANNGSSWTDAFNYLQDAFTVANDGDEIRVAQGIYKPDQGAGITSGDREATFQLINGVTIKGGYVGFGSPDPNARDINACQTILSGDLNGDDGSNFAYNGENSYHVLNGSETDETAVIDGFTIAGGNANHHLRYYGGGIYIHTGSPTLINCIFIGNSAAFGGGMCNMMEATKGYPVLINCMFSGNSAWVWGGGIYSVGYFSECNPTLINCTFSSNDAYEDGGGIYSRDHSKPILTNCIFWSNSDSGGTDETGQIYSEEGVLINNCCVQGWTGSLGGTGNIGIDPMFVDSDGTDNVVGTKDDNLRLLPASPCINAGDNSAVPPSLLTDLDGEPRIMDAIVDMGAYEGPHQGFLLSSASVTVPEGQTATFTVALAMDPLGTVEVTVVAESGDPDITVESGELLTFDSANYAIPQTITLAASEDVDYLNGIALILINAPDFFTGGINAVEEDNDAPTAKVLFVDADAPGINTGLSWSDAFTQLQDALTVATEYPNVIEEIRVAEGTYKPDRGLNFTPGDRTATFRLINELTIKGGYAGFGEPEPNDRDIAKYQTILSADLNDDDIEIAYPENLLYEPTRADNSYHVLTVSETDSTAVLDGFKVVAGNASDRSHYHGGGIYIDSASPTLACCTFISNSAYSQGGAIYNKGGKPALTNCTFSGNFVQSIGGAIYNWNAEPTLTGCTFIGNYGGVNGGGMYDSNSSSTLLRCMFTGNSAEQGAGMYNNRSAGSLKNCIFKDNTATGYGGGGVHNNRSNPMLTGCIFIDNSASSDGGGLSSEHDSSPTLINCTFSGNLAYTGGGMSGGGTLTNCTFIANSAWSGGGIITGECTFTGCTFTGNSAQNVGGAIANYFRSWKEHPILLNCIFTGNIADYGGAIYNHEWVDFPLTNCTFNANKARNRGGAMWNGYECLVTLTGCILWGDIPEEIYADDSTSVATYSNFQGGLPGEGNIDVDPLFIEQGYWDANDVWIDGDYHLLLGSPCIDAGDPNYIPEPNETDLDGKPRVLDGDNDGVPVVDMGAYEYRLTISAEARIVPRTINLASKGKWLTCYIRLPDEYDVADIEPNSVFLEDEIKPEQLSVDEQTQVATAIFNREDVQAILETGDINLAITGQLTDGTVFEARDTIKVLNKIGRKSPN